MQLTPEQKKVIEVRDKNILVSAAAGSGKTAVLVERILGLVLDENNPVDIDRLLIVTFTNAAAGEMRQRIGEAIEKRLLEDADNEHLQRQSTLLHRAQITTIDSFCLFVIKNNFNEIGLDPGFRVADTGEIELLKQDIINEMFEELLNNPDTKDDFVDLLEHVAIRGKEKVLEETILKLYSYSQSFPWPKEWLQDRYTDYDISEGIENTLWGQLWKEQLEQNLRELEDRIRSAIKECVKPGGPYLYVEALEADLEMISLLRAKGFEEQYEMVRTLSHRNLPRKSDPAIIPEIREYVKGLRDDIKKDIGKLKEDYFSLSMDAIKAQMKAIAKIEKILIDTVLLFSDKFEAKKRDKNILDFHDMEHMALDILISRKTDPKTGERTWEATKTALDYSCYYKEIMIDEYQDSNLVQEYLLQSISKENLGEYNRFMVGDLKQSIYKFRLARPEIFLEKYHAYSNGEDETNIRIDLHKNFRSRKEVLESVNHVFYQIMGKDLGKIEYTREEALYVGMEYPQGEDDYATELLLLDSKEEDAKKAEAKMIAGRIKQLVGKLQVLDKESGNLRSAKYKDIVILLRSNEGWDEEFQNVLLEEDIPVTITRKTGYFSSKEIQTILSFLKTIDNPKQDIPLYGTMKSLLGRFTEEEIVQVKQMGEKYLFDNLQKVVEGDLGVKVRKFLDTLNRYRDMVYVMPIYKLIRVYLKETGYLGYYAAMTGGEQRVANIRMLLEKAESYEKTSYFGLFHFMRYLEQLKKYDVDIAESSSTEEVGDMVRIMSIHKSKGLEFPICILAGMSKKINQQDTNAGLVCDMDLGLGMEYRDSKRRIRNTDLRRNVLSRKMKLDNLGEELRILYVAMTRAKEKMIMTGMVNDYEKHMLSYSYLKDREEEKLPYGILCRSNHYLDFVLPTTLRSGGVIKTILWNPWEERVQKDTQEVAMQMERMQLESRLLAENSDFEQEITNKLNEDLRFEYKSMHLQGLYAKTSVSELKMKAMEEADEGAYRLFEETEQKEYVPEFIEAKGEVSGTTRGNAYHRLMELMDFSKVPAMDAIWQDMEQLAEEKVLEPLYLSLVRKEKLEAFLQSDLAERMKKAQKEKKLHREQPFVYGLEASRLDEKFPKEEKVLIQGIVDAYFEENGELVIVDYKTDAIHHPEELIGRYKEQLKYYKEALEKLTAKKVKEMILYSYALNEAVYVEAE